MKEELKYYESTVNFVHIFPSCVHYQHIFRRYYHVVKELAEGRISSAGLHV